MAIKEGALTRVQMRVMIAAGFLPTEVQAFNDAKSPDGSTQDLNFEAENFQSMLKSRRKWIDDLKALGWSKKQIILQIHKYYVGHRSKRSPFDFLQIEASPSARQKGMTDTELSRKLLKRTRVSRSLGKGYGKPVKVPRNIPKPPRFSSM